MGELSPLGVRATAGSHRAAEGVLIPHVWTEEGVVAAPAANGAQVLHLAIALCVLNDVYREGEHLGVQVDGVAVTADGGFDETWTSTGIAYQVEVDSPADPDAVRRLLEVVDDVAEIPKAVRAGAEVTRR